MEADVPDEAPPLVVDVDGTLTDETRAVDPRVVPVLRRWPAPVVLATGKALPYPVAFCEFLGIEKRVIAENGGVVLASRDGPITFEGDPEAARAVAADLAERGYDLGWGEADLVNRWRETELAVSHAVPEDVVTEVAAARGLVVVDSGFAYHVTAPDVDKGRGLRILARSLDRDPGTFVAIGDSENDAPTFEVVDRAVAVGNADDRAKAAADHVTDATYADGFLAAVDWLVGDGETA